MPRAIEAVGERWSLLILRAAFDGIAHYEHFRHTLGIARNILADRLTRLVDHAILERRTCAADRRRIEYRLTEKGAALLPILVALHQWGDRWGACGRGTPALVDTRDGPPLRPVAAQAADGRLLGLGDLRWDHDGPRSPG